MTYGVLNSRNATITKVRVPSITDRHGEDVYVSHTTTLCCWLEETNRVLETANETKIQLDLDMNVVFTTDVQENYLLYINSIWYRVIFTHESGTVLGDVRMINAALKRTQET